MKESYYFSHDSNALIDPKILEMRCDYGMEGYGIFWSIIEMLRNQNEYKQKLNATTYKGLKMLCMSNVDIEEFILKCINEYKLFETDGEYFWSESLCRRMGKKDDIIQRRKEAAQKRWNKNDNANDMQNYKDGKQMQCKCNANAFQIKENEIKENKIKENEIKNTPLTPQGEVGETNGESLTVLKTAGDEPEDGSHSKTRTPRKRKKTGNLTEEQQEMFDKFWQAYPNKKSPGQAERTFAKLSPDDALFELIMAGIDRAKKYDFRFRESGRYAPYPSSWLNAKGWLDCFDTEAPKENNKKTGDDDNGSKFKQNSDPYENIGSVEI